MRGALHTDPYIWSAVEDFFDPAMMLDLLSEFPADGFRIAGPGPKSFFIRSLVVNSALPSSTTDLSPTWQSMGRILASPDYRVRLGEFVGRDLSRLRIDATLCRYTPGCWLPPHTDRDIRDTTHVIYFNREWSPEWGGMFQILASERPDDIVAEVVPKLNISVVMVRSERSWHAVSSVVPGVERDRLSLLIHASSGV